MIVSLSTFFITVWRS